MTLGSLVASADNALLQGGQVGQGALYPQVAAGHHDHIRFAQNGVQIVHGTLPLQLDHHRHALAGGGNKLLGLPHVVGGLHVGNGHGVHAQFEAIGQVFFVFFRQGAHLGGLAGQGQPFAGGHKPCVFRFQFHQAVGAPFPHRKLQAAVGQHHAVAGFQTFQNDVVVKRQIGGFGYPFVRGAQQQAHALAHADGFFGQKAQADFGAGKILHNGDGPRQRALHRTDAVNNGHEVRRAAVGKIEAEHADSGFGQSQKFFTAVGGGANGGDDLGFHGLFPNMPC